MMCFYRQLTCFGLVACLLSGLTGVPAFGVNKMVKPHEMREKDRWVKTHFTASDPVAPFSFKYDGVPADAFLLSCAKSLTTEKLDANRTRYTLTWVDRRTGLSVKCVAVDYNDFPVVEWTVYLKNTGIKNTPMLKDIQALDMELEGTNPGPFSLNGIKGDFCTADSYEPFRMTLWPGPTERFSPPDYSGKSCDGPRGWPYQNLQVPRGGIIVAIGWPGQWESSYTKSAGRSLTVRAGQQLTNLYLKPGEEFARLSSLSSSGAGMMWCARRTSGAGGTWRM